MFNIFFRIKKNEMNYPGTAINSIFLREGKKMIAIKCARCNKKIFKYKKIGKGKILHCWNDRIIEDFSLRQGNKVLCQCGNLIGVVEGKWIKMKQHAFNYSGTISKK